MDFNRTWTKFALEAEHEMFGMDRIATVHNKLQAELTRVREELAIEKAKFPTMGSPLQKLGAMLADLLDEDRFAQAEQFMLAEYVDKERVARRAAVLFENMKWEAVRSKQSIQDALDAAVAQAMREVS